MSKDKRAAALKRKRRLEREAVDNVKKDELYQRYRVEMKKHGVKAKHSKEQIWQEYKRSTMDIYRQSIMAALICTMHCLHKEGWGCERLWRLFNGTARIITAVFGSNERSVEQLADELIHDAGVDIKAVVGDYRPWNGVSAAMKSSASSDKPSRTRSGAMLENIVPAMVIVLFELYNQYGWKAKRMNRIAAAVKEVYIFALENDTLDEVRRGLEKDLKITIEYDGSLRR